MAALDKARDSGSWSSGGTIASLLRRCPPPPPRTWRAERTLGHSYPFSHTAPSFPSGLLEPYGNSLQESRVRGGVLRNSELGKGSSFGK